MYVALWPFAKLLLSQLYNLFLHNTCCNGNSEARLCMQSQASENCANSFPTISDTFRSRLLDLVPVLCLSPEATPIHSFSYVIQALASAVGKSTKSGGPLVHSSHDTLNRQLTVLICHHHKISYPLSV